MGSWHSDFIGNDNFQDELMFWQELTDSDKVRFFNTLYQKALKESSTFFILVEEPIDPDPEIDYSIPIFNPEQFFEDRELFLGFIQHLIELKSTQLLSKKVLEDSLVLLRQFGNAQVIEMQGWRSVPERFSEIYKVQTAVKELLAKF